MASAGVGTDGTVGAGITGAGTVVLAGAGTIGDSMTHFGAHLFTVADFMADGLSTMAGATTEDSITEDFITTEAIITADAVSHIAILEGIVMLPTVLEEVLVVTI